ncbi:MAG: glycosyltransferase family 39 protein [Chloroflexota bacterium]
MVRVLTYGFLLLAFALRAYHLDFQSFWSDEGISLLRSAQPLAEMLREMPVEHMPGYFTLLHFWLRMTGEHDFAIRFLSLWPSVLTIAIAYRFAADMGNRHAGIWAGLLLATNGFHIWYAQEARMYSWLLAMSLLASWLLWRALHSKSWWPWLGYTLATTANIYLHFYGFLTPLAHTIFMLVWLLVHRDWRQFLRWVTAGVGVVILFLPWLPRTIQIFEFSGWRPPADPTIIPWQFLAAFTVGDTMPMPWHNWLPIVYLIGIVIGCIGWWLRHKMSALLLLITMLIPWAAVIALALRNPDFHERYAIAISGPLLLLSVGWVWTADRSNWRARIGGVLLPLILIGPLIYFNGIGLQELYHNASLHKPDFRGAAQRIQQGEKMGDVILVDGPDPEKVFLHYYSGPNEVHDLRFLEEADNDTIYDYIGDATANSNQIWELLYFRRPGPVQVWTATQAWTTQASDHNDIRVTLYGQTEGPMVVNPLNVHFTPALLLEQVELDTLTPRRGDILHITTRWHTVEQANEYKFSLRLWHTREGASPEMVLLHDYFPQNEFAPTHVWWVGNPATDQRGFLLPDDLMPGPYQVTLRLYDPASGEPVDTDLGQDVLLAEIRVIE